MSKIKDGKNRILPGIWREIVLYDSSTGKFYWKTPRREHYQNQAAFLAAFRIKKGREAFTNLDNHGYFKAGAFGRMYKAHTVAYAIVYGKYPKAQLDHINGIRIDNRISNLREADNESNHRNMKMSSRNKSGVTGVFFDKKSKKWRSEIRHQGKSVNLGLFDTVGGAAQARSMAQEKYGYHENHGLPQSKRSTYEAL